MSRGGESGSLTLGGYSGVWHWESVMEMPRSHLRCVGVFCFVLGFFHICIDLKCIDQTKMMGFLQMRLQYSQCCNHITSVDIDPVFPANTHQNIFLNQIQYIIRRSRANYVLFFVLLVCTNSLGSDQGFYPVR